VVLVHHRGKERQVHPILQEEALLRGTDDISGSDIGAECKNLRNKENLSFQRLDRCHVTGTYLRKKPSNNRVHQYKYPN
jgi:hypothetical protein